MQLKFIRNVALVATLCAAFAVGAHAIDVNARIKGTVTDSTKAIVPGVTVIATNEATGVVYTTKTNSSGDYLFPQLPIGSYTVKVANSGFKTFEAKGIVLTIDQEYVETIQLTVGNTGEVLEVKADALQVNTTDMQLNNIVSATQMEELPLIGRGFTSLELIEPGVQSSSDRFGTFSASGSQTQQSEYLINGADTNDLALNTPTYTPNLDAIDQFNLIEGSLNAEYDRNSGGIVSATLKQGSNHIHGDIYEFYRDTFLNTNNWFQKTFSTTGARTDTVAKYHQNIFGGTIGGPIVKDKLFLFLAYNGTRQVVPESGGSVSVYSAANLTGDFSADLAANAATANHQGLTFLSTLIPGTITGLAASNPAKCTPNGTNTWAGCLNALGGQVPTTAFNTISSNFVKKYVPLPNNSGVGPYNYTFHPLVTTKANQDIGRLDYSISPKDSLTLIGVYNRSSAPETLPFTGASLPGFGDVSTSYTQQYTIDYVHQFSSSLVNDLAFHWTRFNYQAVIPQVPALPTSAGFSINSQNTAGAGLPTQAVSGFFTLGFSTNGPQPRIDQVYQAADSVSKVLGSHVIKAGYDGRRFNVSNPFSARNNGSFSFTASTSTNPYTTGDPSLDYLLGIPGSYSQGSGAAIQAQAFLNYMFVQDTWKMTNNFTLDYGLGWSIDTPLVQKQYGGEAIVCLIGGQQSQIFTTAPKGLNYPGDPGCNNAGGAKLHLGELGPRLGFAWSPNLGKISAGDSHKFSIRAGFGIYYDRTEEESSLESLTTPPFGQNSAGAADYASPAGPTINPAFANPFQDINTGTVYANKFPFVFPTPGATINWSPLEPIGKSTYSPGFRAPYAENFQMSVEREFPSRIVARVSYVASLAHRNVVTPEGNYETAAGHAACLANALCSANTNAASPNLNPAVPARGSGQSYYFPTNTAYGSIDPITAKTGFTSIGLVTSEGSSNYNSLQAEVTKATTHGLSFQLSYTYSHALDNGSSFENSGFGSSGRGYNQFQQSLNYGNSAFDARQRLVFAPIYITPFVRKDLAWYHPLNLALSGWQVSSITTEATGFPFDISYAGGTSNSLYCSSSYQFYACPDVPVQNGPLVTVNPRLKILGVNTGDHWFDNSSKTFTPEQIGTFGNTSRNEYHGPGINNTDMVLAKNFNLSADGVRKLQLRMTSSNVFNHTQFSNPGSTTGSYNSNNQNGFSSAFGQITSAASARATQLAAKIYF
jgi:hypothetical protein